jgi:hypothetical protein
MGTRVVLTYIQARGSMTSEVLMTVLYCNIIIGKRFPASWTLQRNQEREMSTMGRTQGDRHGTIRRAGKILE